MKQKYEELEIEVLLFDTEDVIATSNWGEEENEGPINPDF